MTPSCDDTLSAMKFFPPLKLTRCREETILWLDKEYKPMLKIMTARLLAYMKLKKISDPMRAGLEFAVGVNGTLLARDEMAIQMIAVAALEIAEAQQKVTK